MKVGEYNRSDINLSELYFKLKKEYDHVYLYQIDETAYFYRPLKRNEYRDMINNKELTDMSREDLLVSTCLLYPPALDIDNAPAGLITTLSNLIIDCSYLNKEDRSNVLNYYRNEMAELDNQISCIIHEAFQTIPIEEIDSWDIEKTMDYFARSEWILHTLRGVPINREAGESALESANIPEIKTRQSATDYDLKDKPKKPEETPDESKEEKPNHRGGTKTMTPEKLAELKRKYPTIDWEHDDGLKGIDGLAQPSVSTEPGPLRLRSELPPTPKQ